MEISTILEDGILPIFMVVIFYGILIPRYSRRTTLAVLCGGCALMEAVYIAAVIHFPGLPPAGMSLFFFSIPSCLIFLGLSKIRGSRFWLGFCTLGIVEFAIVLIVKLTVYLMEIPAVLCAAGCITVNLLYVKYFYKIKDRIKEILVLEVPGWKRSALAVALAYGFTYWLVLYPRPLLQRPEDMPVMIVFGLVILASVSVLYLMMDEIYKEKMASRSEYRMRQKLERMQMRLMVSQMKPHFVANSMNAIKVLIRKDPQKAVDMVTDFSNYLRASIDGIEMKELIPFEEELEHIRAYLSIQQMRFGERLQVNYDIREKEFFLPPLSVEPLVENAVHHGIAAKEEGGTVTVRSWSEGKRFRILVEDDGVGFHVESLENGGDDSVGLAYVGYSVGRIPGAMYEIESKPGYGTKVLLSFPWGDAD